MIADTVLVNLPPRTWPASLRVGVALAALAVVVAALIPSHTPTATAHRLATPSRPANVGDPVRDGALEFRVASMECGIPAVGQEPAPRTPQGRFCVVTVAVRNAGVQFLTISDAQLSGRAAGVDYFPDVEADRLVGGTPWPVTLPPGGATTGRLAFDLPGSVRLDLVVLRGWPGSAGVAVATR